MRKEIRNFPELTLSEKKSLFKLACERCAKSRHDGIFELCRTISYSYLFASEDCLTQYLKDKLHESEVKETNIHKRLSQSKEDQKNNLIEGQYNSSHMQNVLNQSPCTRVAQKIEKIGFLRKSFNELTQSNEHAVGDEENNNETYNNVALS